MNSKLLQWINLAGVCLLWLLCAIQWQANRRMNLERIDLLSLTSTQGKMLADRDQTIRGNIADMNDFRERLAHAQDELKNAQETIQEGDAKLVATNAQLKQSQMANDSLKSSLEQWKSAVAARDDALKQADEQVKKLLNDRSDAVSNFNELATRYNAAQDQLKQAADQLKNLADDRNDAVAKFNDLANKYNALVKQMSPATTKP